MKISPKVYVPVAIALLAAVALYLLTGDESWLTSILVSLTAGVGGVAVSPARKVTQGEVQELSEGRIPESLRAVAKGRDVP